MSEGGGQLDDRGPDFYPTEPNPLLIVLSGPSGVGKDAVLKRMKKLGYPFHLVVTATDRPWRPGEVDGVDYYFLSTEEFTARLERGEFLEHANVYGERKGVPKAEVRKALASGQDAIMRVDVQGAATIRQKLPEAVFIFLSPSSEEDLIRHLKKRGTETPEALARRITAAREEMERLPGFDYVIVNRDGQLDETVKQITAIITAEKCRVKQRKIEL